jgi:hypothetical protein
VSINNHPERRDEMGEDKFAEAMIELNEFLEGIKEDGILTKEEIIQEVDNVFG